MLVKTVFNHSYIHFDKKILFNKLEGFNDSLMKTLAFHRAHIENFIYIRLKRLSIEFTNRNQ